MGTLQWTIQAQGNANIAYSDGNRNILRVAKNPETDSVAQLEYSQLICSLLSEFSAFHKASIVDLSNYSLNPRPEHSVGILMDDVTEDVSIELKPKGAIVDLVFDKNPCLYCMYDFKSPSYSGNSSEYCPFMLYSGNRNTMKKGLLELLDNPKSHFKVHQNGKVHRFKDALSDQILSEDSLDHLVDALMDSDVLNKLKAAQELLHIDIKDVFELYNIHKPVQPALDELKCVLSNLKANNRISDIQKIQSYLMSRTLRDLSLMISFQTTVSVRDTIKGKLPNSDLFYSIDILDLDLKPISRIPKYYNNALEAAIISKGITRYCTT